MANLRYLSSLCKACRRRLLFLGLCRLVAMHWRLAFHPPRFGEAVVPYNPEVVS